MYRGHYGTYAVVGILTNTYVVRAATAAPPPLPLRGEGEKTLKYFLDFHQIRILIEHRTLSSLQDAVLVAKREEECKRRENKHLFAVKHYFAKRTPILDTSADLRASQ